MTAKLNQILAVEKGSKARAEQVLTETYHAFQKPIIISGIARAYTPRDEEGDRFPPESTRVQVKTKEAIARVEEALGELFDVTATKDLTNCSARADIRVGDKLLLADVPATYLLFLEKQLVNLMTFIRKMPTLDPAETWHFDSAQGVYATEPVETIKTKKIMKNHVKAPATDKFPAQVEVYTEDAPVGTWRTIKYSGALPVTEVEKMLARVAELQKAVKFAREEANTAEVKRMDAGRAILGYIFGA